MLMIPGKAGSSTPDGAFLPAIESDCLGALFAMSSRLAADAMVTSYARSD